MSHVRLFRFVSASLIALGLTLAPARAQSLEVEPNSSCASAQSLGLSYPLTVQGSLAAADVDYYRITGTPGDLVTIDQLGGASSNGTLQDPFLGVFNSGCALLAYADYDASLGNWLDARIEIRVPADGVLVVAASSAYDWDLSGLGGGTGSYRLDVRKTPLAHSVNGRLVDAKTGAPLIGATLDLVRCDNGFCWITVGYGFTDANGVFRFEPGNGTVWDTVLRAGEYRIVVYPPTGYLNLESPLFNVGAGEDYDLGNVAVSPIPVVNSVRGRVVDALNRAPLSGSALPFTQVELLSCPSGWSWCYSVASQQADAQGGFLFTAGFWGPLEAGVYKVRVYADQYSTTESAGVAGADGEDVNLGDVAVKSYPVRLTLAQGCGPIPSTGGACDFKVRVTNGGTAPLKADSWTLVRAIGTEIPGEVTQFQAGTAKPVNLASGVSTDLAFTFNVPGSLRDGTTICARTYAAEKKNAFSAIGSHDLFCLQKGSQGFTLLTGKEKREILRKERAR